MDLTDATQATRIKQWINRVYTDICVKTEALQESDTITLTANVASYTLPSAVLRINQMVIKQANQSGYNTPLELIDLKTMLRFRQSNAGLAVTNGTAMYYSISGQDDLDLFPTPSTADTLLMYYVKTPAVLVNNTDVPAIPEPYATEVIEAGALVHATDYLKDFISGYTYRQVYEQKLTEFRQHLSKREGAQTKQFARAADLWRPPNDPSVDNRS